jgi:response regulator RpfG family c-di-GMP phosphodiesterase
MSNLALVPPSGSGPEFSSGGPSGADAPTRILVVDDEPTIRLALGRFLRMRGYDVEDAAGGQQALDLIAPARFALMVCDVRMPGLSGLDVVPRALERDPDLAVVMLSAVNDAPTARDALVQGAADYLTKPVELTVLLQAVERALHRRALALRQREVERVIREEIAARTAELDRERAALHAMSVQVAESLVAAMEAKDTYLRGHSARVADLAASVATELGLDEDAVEHVRLAGRLQDVGKIGLRESVLNKPDRLTPEEYEHVRSHVRIGLDILAPLRHLGPVLAYVADHHEHWDGSGYPRGLVGEEISVGGRILAACDAFYAVSSGRTYQAALSERETIDYLATRAGTHLDPRVFAALRSVVVRGHSLTFLE